jgi:hypothetical protein
VWGTWSFDDGNDRFTSRVWHHGDKAPVYNQDPKVQIAWCSLTPSRQQSLHDPPPLGPLTSISSFTEITLRAACTPLSVREQRAHPILSRLP